MGASASRGMERVIGEAPRPPASQGDGAGGVSRVWGHVVTTDACEELGTGGMG
jgi:hypothetical protein